MASSLTDQQKERRQRDVAKKRAALKKRPPAQFGSLRVLPSGLIQARYTGPDGGRYAAPHTFDTIGDAETWLGGIRREIQQGTWVSPNEREAEDRREAVKGTTVAKLFSSYLDDADLKPRTLDLYRYQYDRLIAPTLADRVAAELTPTDVAEWRARLPKAPRQREQATDLLRSILGLGVERQILDHNPAARSRRKSKGSTRRSRRRAVPRLTREEVATMAKEMPPERQFAVLLSAYTGIRMGEMIALRRRDFDLTRGEDGHLIHAVMHITRAVSRPRDSEGVRTSIEDTPKSDAGRRTIALPAGLLGALDGHLDEHAQEGEDGLLFPGANGGFLGPSTLYGVTPGVRSYGREGKRTTEGRGWNRARAIAGRPDANWHQLRAFAISEAVDTGASPADILHRFGHTDLRTSGLYQRAAQNADAVLASRIAVTLPEDAGADLHLVKRG